MKTIVMICVMALSLSSCATSNCLHSVGCEWYPQGCIMEMRKTCGKKDPTVVSMDAQMRVIDNNTHPIPAFSFVYRCGDSK